jgi:hypothetical protein
VKKVFVRAAAAGAAGPRAQPLALALQTESCCVM